MKRAMQTARPLRGVSELQQLLRAEGLDAEARLLPALAEDVDLGAVALDELLTLVRDGDPTRRGRAR